MFKPRSRYQLPRREQLLAKPLLQRFAPWLAHPALWGSHRRNIAKGVAIGLFCGLLPGPLQMLSAALCALFFRANLPVAIVTTLYTNPLTIIPLYVLAFMLGQYLTGATELQDSIPPLPEIQWLHLGVTLHQWFDWLVALGTPLLIGLLALASSLAIIGYISVLIGWRCFILWRLCQRQRRHQSTQNDS